MRPFCLFLRRILTQCFLLFFKSRIDSTPRMDPQPLFLPSRTYYAHPFSGPGSWTNARLQCRYIRKYLSAKRSNPAADVWGVFLTAVMVCCSSNSSKLLLVNVDQIFCWRRVMVVFTLRRSRPAPVCRYAVLHRRTVDIVRAPGSLNNGFERHSASTVGRLTRAARCNISLVIRLAGHLVALRLRVRVVSVACWIFCG